MRLSQMLLVTLREDPAEAEITSHKLLLRAGYIRRIGSGIYVYLPLMWRVLEKISRIVREEMNATGALECLLPQVQPAELWQESGRWEAYTKAEGIMFSLVDRQKKRVSFRAYPRRSYNYRCQRYDQVISSIACTFIPNSD